MSAESRPIKGPMGRGARGPKPNIKDANKTTKRLMSYVGHYKLQFIFVIFCIIISAYVNVRASMFIQTVIDDYVTPMLASGSADFTSFAVAISRMAVIFFIGILFIQQNYGKHIARRFERSKGRYVCSHADSPY